MVRQGIRALLERDTFTVVGEASDGREAVELAARLRPDMAVLDFVMPRLNGLDAAVKIQQQSPSTKSLLLTMYTEGPYVLEAFRHGLRGYVIKTQAADDLLQALREVKRDAFYLSPGISATVVDACLSRRDTVKDPLTPREREVLQLVAEGSTTKEIAIALDVSVKTAETHRTKIMRKLDIHETAGLVRYAIRRKIIQP